MVPAAEGGGWIKPPTSFRRFCASWRVYLKDRLAHPRAEAYWPECLAVDRMSRDELQSLQGKRLEDLLLHAVSHVPFYRRWAAQAGWRKGDPLRLEDFPIVSKEDFRREPEAFQSERFPLSRMRTVATSGTTGEPFRFRELRDGADYNYCCLWRGLGRFGLRPGQRRVLLWGVNPRAEWTAARRGLHRIRTTIRDHLNNTLLINANAMEGQSLPRALEQAEAFGPVYMHGYASVLYAMSRELLSRGRSWGGRPLAAVVTESEKLYDFQRRSMEKAFGCRVIEHYGCLELGMIAQQDPQGVMRIHEDRCMIEQLDGGEMLATHLFSHAYPFIRYRNGDLIQMDGAVAPGLPYRGLSRIDGRLADLMPVKQGGCIHPFAIATVMERYLDYVRSYQVHQVSPERFIIRYVPEGMLPEDAAKGLVAEIVEIVGRNVAVELRAVERIATTAAGKHRWMISDVAGAALERAEK